MRKSKREREDYLKNINQLFLLCLSKPSLYHKLFLNTYCCFGFSIDFLKYIIN